MFQNFQIEGSPLNIDNMQYGLRPSIQENLCVVGARGNQTDHLINHRLEYIRINKPKKDDNFEDVFINKMKGHLNELHLNLDSLADKQISLYQFKLDFTKNINQYWDVSQENDDLNCLLSMLETSIENLHVEDIQKPQINILEKILNVIQIGDISEDYTESIFYEIVNCGLDPIGSLDGISQLYDD